MSKRPCPSHVGSSTSPSGRRAACRDFGRMLSAPSRRYLPGRRRGPEADPPRVPRRATAAVGALPPAASASAAAAGWPLAMRRVPCRGWRRRPPSWPTPVHRARRRGRRAPATRTPRAAASWEIWVRRAGTAARRGPHAALLPRAPSGAKKLAWGGGLLQTPTLRSRTGWSGALVDWGCVTVPRPAGTTPISGRGRRRQRRAAAPPRRLPGRVGGRFACFFLAF